MKRRTLSDGHVRNNAFNGILPLVFILAVQVSSELKVLAYRHRSWTKGIPVGCASATVKRRGHGAPDLSSVLPLQIHSYWTVKRENERKLSTSRGTGEGA